MKHADNTVTEFALCLITGNQLQVLKSSLIKKKRRKLNKKIFPPLITEVSVLLTKRSAHSYIENIT